MVNFFRSLILPLTEISNILPRSGLIYEIGAGWGSMAAFLAQKSSGRKVIGLDINQDKLNSAEEKYHFSNLFFLKANALTYQYQKCKGIVMSDFLHHVDFSTQEKIIGRVLAKLDQSGVMVIKEIDADDTIRELLSRFWDFLLYPSDKIYYRSRREWQNLLSEFGLEVRSKRAVLLFPGSTILYICTKKTL